VKQKMYEVHQPKNKKADRIIKVDFDITSQPSPMHKFAALNNKPVQFEDKRKKKPKYKPKYDY
jgi:hypothetical protein